MDSIVKSPKLKQRADLTYKHNTVSGRHGWLRLTPAYSVKVVEEVLPSAAEGSRVLDPFSGTATTTLCAATHGMEAVSIDVNPFLVWLGNAKLAHYSRDQLANARAAGTRAIASACNPKGPRVDAPPLFNIERWWPADRLEFLCRLKAALNAEDTLDNGAHDLLSVALCRSVITLSNAAFNHQSMSFKKPTDQPGLFEELSVHAGQYETDLEHVLKSAGENSPVKGKVVEGDSRNVAAALEGRFDLVVTSPPYPNRMSYIRELRPYMYWLDYIKEAREAGELDWKAMGGTWGMATSALSTWERPADGFSTPHFEKVLFDIAHADNKSGEVLSRYVAKYFVDMNNHLASMRTVLNPGAKLHYIVGNSTFYGTLLPVELLFEDMFRGLGFTDIGHVAIRKRNSKKELFEYDVTATWPG